MSQAQAVRLFLSTETGEQQAQLPVAPEIRDAWKLVLDTLVEHLAPATVDTWFRPIKPLRFADAVLVLLVPSRFFFDYIEGNFANALKQAIGKAFSLTTRIEFRVAPGEEHRLPEPSTVPVTAEVVDDPRPEPGPPGGDPPPPFDPVFRFDNFFATPGEEMALRAAVHLSRHPGARGYNPLVLTGPEGSGKTHLLNALGNALLEKGSAQRIHLVRSDQFLHEFVHYYKENRLNDYFRTLATARIFLFDDLHFLAKKSKSQEALLLVLNQLLRRGATVVVSTRLTPAELRHFKEDLVAVLQRGLIVEMPACDSAAREGIIRDKLDRQGLVLEDETIAFLARHIGSNLHDLNAVMVRIIAQMSLMGTSMSLDDVRTILHRMFPTTAVGMPPIHRPQMTIERIVKAVGAFYQVSVHEIGGVSRRKAVAAARQVAMYLCRELTSESLVVIGTAFSNRHHASVLYAHGKVAARLQSDPQLRRQIENLRASLSA